MSALTSQLRATQQAAITKHFLWHPVQQSNPVLAWLVMRMQQSLPAYSQHSVHSVRKDVKLIRQLLFCSMTNFDYRVVMWQIIGRSRAAKTRRQWLSRVALGGRIPAVYDQLYNCHNLRDGGRRPPATMFTTPRLLQRQQQAYRLRIAISAYPTCIRHPRYGGSRRNIAMPFSVEKLEWRGYPMVKKFWWYDYSFWHNSRT